MRTALSILALSLCVIVSGCLTNSSHSPAPARKFVAEAQADAAPPAPENLTVALSAETPDIIPLVVTSGTNNPLGFEHQGLAAYWQLPNASNIWVSEWNFREVNGTNWNRCGNEFSGDGGWHYAETGTNWILNGLPFIVSNQWTARLRNVGTVAPLPPLNTNNPPTSLLVQLPPRSERTNR